MHACLVIYMVRVLIIRVAKTLMSHMLISTFSMILESKSKSSYMTHALATPFPVFIDWCVSISRSSNFAILAPLHTFFHLHEWVAATLFGFYRRTILHRER
jgi:hypothetical protein